MSKDKIKLAIESAFKPKSDDEHRAISQRWLDRIKPTLIDQWPADILALSMKTKFVPIPDGLKDEFFSLHDGKEPGPVMDAFSRELDAIMGWDRWFVRLNSRSPKDWPWPFEIPATISGKEALSILAGSERVLDDLYEFSWVPEQRAYVCLREFVYWIKPEWEFRCFVKDGDLIAVAHYDYTKSTPSVIVEQAEEIRARIDQYFAKKLKPRLHMDTVVFDLAFQRTSAPVDPMLIELNPYGLSDPCWFKTYEAMENASSHIETGVNGGGGPVQERIARAWASIDGKLQEFNTGQRGEDESGHYEGYMAEAAELMKRAGIDA